MVGRKKLIEPITMICVICNKEIFDRKALRFGKLWYCAKCKKEKHETTSKINTNPASLCEYCGKAFTNPYPKRPQIYCCYRCKNNAAQRRYQKRLHAAYQLVGGFQGGNTQYD